LEDREISIEVFKEVEGTALKRLQKIQSSEVCNKEKKKKGR